MESKEIGLVLAGGGGKGAYHIGVWKALKGFGLDQKISAVSGTSVGALNTLLYGNGDFELGEYVWEHIMQKDILRFDAKTASRFLPVLIGAGAIPLTAGLVSMTVKALKNGVFSPQGIEDLILKNIDMQRISNLKMPLYAGSFALSKGKMDYLCMNGRTPDDIKRIAMASSALPIVFPQQIIDGVTYLDGGIKDNVPVKPLYDIGYRKFIVCYLRDDIKDGGFEKKFPDAEFIEIIPREDQGGMIKGTLDFSPEGASRRIGQGYYDVLRLIQDGKLESLA